MIIILDIALNMMSYPNFDQIVYIYFDLEFTSETFSQ